MTIVHLTASAFHGGPERQMLGLGKTMAEYAQSVFVTFPENGRCRAFVSACRKEGLDSVALEFDTPRFRKSIREITSVLERTQARVLLCHGYKSNILGRPAARRLGIPAIAVTRGWTGESWRVRLYEKADRFHLRYMDHVVAVSEAQAEKVRKTGVRPERVSVIHNAIDPDRFVDPDPRYRTKLEKFFRTPRSHFIGTAGRLSPEKGFDVFLGAAARVLEARPDAGFVLFGHGAMKQLLQQQIAMAGLGGAVVLAGFRNDLDRFIPQLDLFVLPSYTEGLPNVVLEACVAGVPVVATEVGGTPEVIEDGVSGFLVPPGDPDALANRMLEALECEERMKEVGFNGRQRVLEQFTFTSQVEGYLDLFDKLAPEALTTEATCKQ